MKNCHCIQKSALFAATFLVAVGSSVDSYAQTNGGAILTSDQSAPSEDIVQLIADEIFQGEVDGQIIAQGNVEALHSGRKLKSSKLIYDRTTGIVTAYGDVAIIETDGTITFAQELTVDDRLATGIVSNLATKTTDGGTLAAKTALRQKNSRNLLSKVVYSACPVCKEKPTPTWAIRARKATQDLKAKTISYNDVVFEVAGIPVFYAPYFKHGDPSQGRQSGFLQAKPGNNSRLGYNWEQPYLQIIDKYSDIIIAPQINEYVNPVLHAKYRRNFYSGKLQLEGSFTKEQYFRKDRDLFGESDWRSHIFGNGNFKLNNVWNWGFGVESASDEFYLYRYGVYGQNIARGPIRSTGSRLISQLYLEGKGDNFFARILAVKFQDLVSPQRRAITPKVSPAIELSKTWDIGPLNGKLNLNSSGVYLDRKDEFQDTARIGAALSWNGRLALKNGILIEPTIFARSSYFKYDNQLNANNINIGNNSFTNNDAAIAIDMRLPMAKYDKNLTYFFEPRINLTSATKTKRNNYVSLEESYGVENNHTSYFNINSNSLYDMWDGGSRITFGLNLGASTKAQQSVNVFVGKQIRSEANPFMDRLSNFDQEKGDWVTQFDIKMNQKFSLSGNARFDDNGKLMRTEFSTNLSIWKLNLNANYNEIPLAVGGQEKASRELITQASFKVSKNINLFFDNWHDYRSKIDLRTRYGVNFGDDCTDIRVFFEQEKYGSRFITPSKGFKVQIAFKTLGAIDDDPFQ